MRHSKRSGFGSIYCRGRVWYIRIRRAEGEWRRAVGQDRKLAEAALAQLRVKVERERVLGVKEIGRVSMADFWPEYEPVVRASLTEAGARNVKAMYGIAREHFGGKALRDITPGDVRTFLVSLRNERGVSAATTNRYRAMLSGVFRVAAERDYAAASNPVEQVKAAREEGRPVPYISDADCRRLEAVAPAEFRPFLILASETGCRRGELERLEWRDVDTTRRRIIVRRSKSKRPREVPLSPLAVAALESVRPDVVSMRGGALVFGHLRAESATRGMEKWTEAAGLPPLRFHDLRHGWASRLAAAGLPLTDIQKLGGWSGLQMVQRYAGSIPDGAADRALAAMARSAASAPIALAGAQDRAQAPGAESPPLLGEAV